jgi:alanyl-tRNA synthetase
VFEFFDTHGLPLDIVLDRLDQTGFVPDWPHLYDRCLKAGWNPTSTWERFRSLVGDVYGPDVRVEWERKMRKHLEDRDE